MSAMETKSVSELASDVLDAFDDDGLDAVQNGHFALEELKERADRPEIPDWVADLLNRRTAVEAVLRAPTVAINKGLPLVPALTAEQMWELANKLSVPADFGSKS